MRYGLLTLVVIGMGLLLVTPAPAQKKDKSWDEVVAGAVAYCRKTQARDGSWGPPKFAPGITGIVVTGLLRTGKVDARDPMVERALKYIESLIDPKAGHIAGKESANLRNYITSVNVLALVAADRPSYKKVIQDAAGFLKGLQWDEGEDRTKDSDFYGGAGYDSKSRPDLSNTQVFLDALIAAGVPRDDPAFKKALLFVSRCQNLKSEHNDRPWAGKINDGSFIYTAALGGDTKVTDKPDPAAGLPGYGSMTYAGIKSLIYCGVSKKDVRVQKAVEWLKKNWTLERNAGMPKPRDQWGLYYYYHTMAKCLDVMGEETFVDARGVKHAWRAEITQALAKRQRADGSWANPTDRWMESNPALVTGYALMTLAYTRPRK